MGSEIHLNSFLSISNYELKVVSVHQAGPLRETGGSACFPLPEAQWY
ncbi:hypothetical protein [Lacrimispora brassicae]